MPGRRGSQPPPYGSGLWLSLHVIQKYHPWLQISIDSSLVACRRDVPRVHSQVPLVQAIYEELASLKNPEAEAKKGLDSPVISKVKGL